MLRVLSIVGTRPEAIKMAPVIKELKRHPTQISSLLCVTGQHREMLDSVLELFEMVPDYDLNLMEEGRSPVQVGAAMLSKLEPVLEKERPDWVIVQGDTTTAMIASVGGYYAGMKIAHVEGGLRTYDKMQPFPEEVNRRIVGAVAELHFTPTRQASKNLLCENVPANQIILTGNTVIDALHAVLKLPCPLGSGALKHVPWTKRIVLVTVHRRENFGKPLESICKALKDIARYYKNDVEIIYPVHMNPNISKPVHLFLDGIPGITLIPPLDYLSFAHLFKRSYLVLTDSGGLQEEAPSLGKPVLVLRSVTERPEAVSAGTSRLVGTESSDIVEAFIELFENRSAYHRMSGVLDLYGDGKSSQRIVNALLGKKVDEFAGPEIHSGAFFRFHVPKERETGQSSSLITVG